MNNLNNILTQVTNTPPDLNGFAADTSGLNFKLNETFVSQIVRDLPSSAPLPAHQQGTDPGFAITFPGGRVSTGETLTYQDWNGNIWSAQMYGGWFVQTCRGTNCPQTDSITGAIQSPDWFGTNWTASRLGGVFVSTKASPAATDSACPADPKTGVSAGSNYGQLVVALLPSTPCSSYVSRSIPVVATGENASVSLSAEPKFTTPSTLYFTTGSKESQPITASGIPSPSISVSGNVPAGFKFNPGSASLDYGGAPNGTYQIRLEASNGTKDAQQTFTLNVGQSPKITSSNTLNTTTGLPVNFLVTTTGFPAPKLSLVGITLPEGLIFTDRGNGTATISGTPGLFGGLACPPITSTSGPQPCGITATNSAGTVTQEFKVSLSDAPSARLVVTTGMFAAGIDNSLRLTSIGAITPISYITGPLPSWLSFRDNSHGSGVLSGRPPAGLSGAYNLKLLPAASGSAIADAPNFLVNVNGTPVFLSPGIARFSVGTYGPDDLDFDGDQRLGVSLANLSARHLRAASDYKRAFGELLCRRVQLVSSDNHGIPEHLGQTTSARLQHARRHQ